MVSEALPLRAGPVARTAPPRGLFAWLESLGTRQLPPAIATGDPDQRARALILLGTTTMATLVGAVLAVVAAAVNARLSTVLLSAVVPLAGAITLVALRRGSDLARVSSWFLIAMWAIVLGSASAEGGLRAAAMGWIGAIPMVGYVLVGRRFAYAGALLGVASVAAFYVFEAIAWLPRREESPMLVAAIHTSVVLFLSAYSILAGTSRDRAIRESEAAVTQLRSREAVLSRALVALEQAQTARLVAETELRLAQKLESLGRLAAGVAHEINTPVQFVSDSVAFLQSAFADLDDVVQANRHALAACRAGAPLDEALLAAVDEAEEEADLEYLLTRLPEALGRAKEGLARIADIVRSMKEFSHQSGSASVPADLNRAIRSTLTVAAGEYKYVADLKTDLGDLPLVTCNLGEINQVVLNLVVNAAHAIQDAAKPAGSKGTIAVRTWRDGADAYLSVGDDGTGIAESIRDRVFDPFFTTKEVGRGSGQGLALVRGIVERHRGAITIDSAEGKGTVMTVRLPIG